MQQYLIEQGFAPTLAGDMMFFLILAVAGVGVGFLIGKHRLMGVLISIYLAVVVLAAFPQAYLPNDPIYVFLIFCGVVIGLTLLDEQLFDVNAEITLKMWKSVLLGFFVAVLFVSVVLDFLPEKSIPSFLVSHALDYFVSPWARFGWTVAPLAFLFIIQKRWK